VKLYAVDMFPTPILPEEAGNTSLTSRLSIVSLGSPFADCFLPRGATSDLLLRRPHVRFTLKLASLDF
jgi:hypothetical protein